LRVGLPWLEQGTSVLSGPRSSQLSYRPVAHSPCAHEQLKSEKQQTSYQRHAVEGDGGGYL
jgi:hypothetical protein